jgi:PST family polysaccharide transporter
MVTYAGSNVDSYTIGMRWGASALGVYNRAFQMFQVPANQLLGPLTNVALPLLSRRRHEGGDFYPLLWKAQVAISAALTYVFVLAAALAPPLVRIVLGSRWNESAPLLTILSIGGAAQVLSSMAFWAFLASGRTRQLLFHSLVTKPLLAACILLGSIGGLQGVAWGFSTGLVVSWFISLAWLKRCDGMPASRFLRSGVHVLLCGLVAGGLGWVAVTQMNSHVPTAVLLAGGFVMTTAIYVPLLLLSTPTRRLLIDISRPTFARLRAGVLRG